MDLSSESEDDLHDDACALCGGVGEIICCGSCPSVFHQNCLTIKELPPDDIDDDDEYEWHCFWCCCKFCGLFEESSKQNTTNKPNSEYVILSYHKTCVDANNDETVHFNRAFICGKRCQEVFERLEILLGEKHQIEDDYCCNFLRKSHVTSSSDSKLDVVLTIMYESFEPSFIYHKDQTIETIPSILFSRWTNSPFTNFDGFFTVILEKGDEIISVATIRIHGNQMAEMPYIATRPKYRNQGMCRRLLNAIESALSYLNVEMLVMPSEPEVAHTWISCFGFEPLDLAMENFMKYEKVVPFFGVQMLQKKISNYTPSGENVNFIEAFNFHKNRKVNEEKKLLTKSRVNAEVGHEIITKKSCGESSSRRRP
ncbi:hypothetical protein P8452_66833 [Trifolium repens]|nr:hypothetical protein P8452_66833 [Trifolium repens]